MSDFEQEPSWIGRRGGLVVGVALALLPMLVRLQSPLDLLPYWDGDPLSQEANVIGLTPGLSLAGDVISLLGAAILLALSPRRGIISTFTGLVLAAAGAVACLWHIGHGEFNAKEIALAGTWISGMAVAFALWCAGGEKSVRLLAFSLIVGCVGLLAVKGVYQVAVEHPATVEAFRRDREAIFARNGWSADSSMAKAYERRLMQSEATGWFGFANVYASFAAMGVVAFGVLTVGAWRSWRRARAEREEDNRWPLALVAGGFALSVAALAMAGAKGGYAAAALGLGVGAVLTWLRARPVDAPVKRISRLVGPTVIALPLLAVVARGLVGERIGELSILFRWFYTQGAARVLAEHALHGVGPDGFQAAYAIAKNPLSPEDVTSPHSLLWDWAACLGMGGLLWGALLVWMSTRIGPAAVAVETSQETEETGPDDTRFMMRAVCLIAALAAMLSIPTQYAALLPEEALGVRIGGLVVWCVLSCAALAVARRCSGWTIAVAAAACTLLAHTQIEITGIWVQSCGPLLAVIALAAAGGRPHSQAGGARWPMFTTAAAATAMALVMANHAQRAAGWQTHLHKVYQLSGIVRQLRTQIAGASSSPAEQNRLKQELAANEQIAVPGMIRLLPSDWPLARSRGQLAMHLAHQYASISDAEARRRSHAWSVAALAIALDAEAQLNWPDFADDAVPTIEQAAASFTRLVQAPVDHLDSLRAGWAATVCIAAADALPTSEQPPWLTAAVRYLERANDEDPYNPAHLLRLMDVQARLGDKGVQATAKRLLEVNALQRLDPAVRGLGDSDRGRAERIAAGK
jgi:hypothetical protein